MNKTKFNQAWLEKMNKEGNPIRRWLKQGAKDSTFICSIYKTAELDCGNKGWQSLEQHMSNKRHQENIKLIKGNTTFVTVIHDNDVQSQQHSRLPIISTITLTHPTKTISFQD